MSWSTAFATGKDFERDITEAEVTLGPHAAEEATEQIAAAKTAAITLIESGVIGEHDEYRVTLGGHANLDHKDDPLWASEMIHLSITAIKNEVKDAA